MWITDSFSNAFAVAREIRKEWLFAEDGTHFNEQELEELAVSYDHITPLEEDEVLVITEDGSIGMVLPNVEEPLWYFVSPEFAVLNILHDDPAKYAETPKQKFCGNCGAPLKPGSKFCSNCGAKNS